MWKRKLMICRSIIFGAVFLFDAGEFEYNETTMEYIRHTLNRELLVSLIHRIELTEDKQITIKFRFRQPEAVS